LSLFILQPQELKATESTSQPSRNQKGSGLSGKFQIPNPKSQIPNKVVSFGQILNASGEENKAAFLSFKKLRKKFWPWPVNT
jgi:hypothetical protein